MAKTKKNREPRRKSTIGTNPLDQVRQVPGKNRRKARFEDESPQSEIKEVLLQRRKPKEKGGLSWLSRLVTGMLPR